MPDSSSKSGSARQPSSRPPFRRDWPGIRFSSWNAGFQLEKRIPKTTFITAPFQEGLAGDPLFELECRIPARKADPQDNLHHGPRGDWLGIRFSRWNAGFQLEKRIPKTTFITAPFQEGLAGIRFSSWNAGFQLEKRIPKTTFITAPFQEGLAGDPLFELECRIPARKADPQDNLHHGPLFRRDWPRIRFSSWNAGFQIEKRIPKTTFITAPFQEGLAGDPLFELECRIPARKADFITAPFQEGLAGDPLFELECRIPARKADPQDNLHHGPLSGGIGRRSAFRAGMPDSSSKSGSPRQNSSRPPFRRDWPGIPKTTFITAPFQEGLAGDPLFELQCRIPARKADPQDNLHHGPLSGGIGRGSAFRAGMPDSSSKSGSPRQPSSRPPFRRDWPGIRFSSWNAGFQLEKRIPKTTFITASFQEGIRFSDWPGIRFSSWNAGFQLEKRIPKTTFITAPFQEGLAGDPLFELECRIPARKADPQDNLYHGPLSGGIGRGSAFRAGMPDSSSKSGSPRQPSSRPPFRRDWPGTRFSSWNAGFQLEKRISKTTFITAPFQEGLAGDPLFELECRIPAQKADPQDNLHHGPLSGGIGRGPAFRAGMPDSSSKSGSPRQPSSRPPFSRVSAFRAGIRHSSSKSGSARQPSRDPLFGLAGDPLFELECRIPARKADPQDNLHHGPLSGGIGRGSAFRAGMPDSSSKSGSPRQPSSRPPFQKGLAGDPLFEWVTSVTRSLPTQKRLRPQDPFSQWSRPFSAIGRGLGFRIPP